MSETRKLAAILVADIVGYSRLAGADEDRILARLRTLRSDLIDPTIAVHHGRVVKRTGDGAIIEFRSVVDAVRCAIEVQSGLAERNAGLPPEKRIEYRVGIHVGDVVEESDGDLMGDGVNIAARLEGVCEPSAICLSEDAYRQVKSRLDLKVSDLGPMLLKNIAEPLRAYSLEIGALSAARAAAPAGQGWSSTVKPRLAFASLAAGIVALVILVVGVWHFLGANHAAPVASNAPAARARLSMVVLPFANLSGDPTQDSLADALTDALTTGIARLPDTFVIAHNTALTYKGKPIDAKAIGKDLGVRYVLEGSIQPSGDQVRVTAQLIDADSGAHLWADQFDAPRADRLQTQDEIVARLARAMAVELPQLEAARFEGTPKANRGAEDLALQCSALLLKVAAGRTRESPFWLCEEALDLDPNNVRALTWLSLKFLPPGGRGSAPTDDFKRANQLLSKALDLNPSYADAHAFRALALESQDRLDEAILEDQRAIDSSPAHLWAYENMGYAYRRLGRFEKSLGFVDKAIRLSPRDPNLAQWYADKAAAHLALKQYDQAIEWARRSIALGLDDWGPYLYLVTAFALTGQDSQAHEGLARYLALPGAPKSILALKQARADFVNDHTDPRYFQYWDRLIEGARKAGVPET
jgi:TolB-like protein/class 3 adenylate cyclase/Tfp pilus assembly protein PilF